MRRYWNHYFSFTEAETVVEAFFRGWLLMCFIVNIIICIENILGI